MRLTATPLDAYHLYQSGKVHLAAVAGYMRHRIVASHNLSHFVGQAKNGTSFGVFQNGGESYTKGT